MLGILIGIMVCQVLSCIVDSRPTKFLVDSFHFVVIYFAIVKLNVQFASNFENYANIWKIKRKI